MTPYTEFHFFGNKTRIRKKRLSRGFIHLCTWWNGRSQYFSGSRPVLLSSMPGSPEGAGGSSLWTLLLYGLYYRLLESGWREGGLQLSPMQTDLHSKTCTEQKHHSGWNGGETGEDNTSKCCSCWSWRCGVQRLYCKKGQSCQVLLDVHELLLSSSPWTAWEVLQRQETPFDGSNWTAPADDL